MSNAQPRLRLLSYNIQAGTTTARYREYFTRSWRQVLPNNQRVANLDAIAELIGDYDLVALQEVDAGSLRSGFLNQAKYLATHAGFPYWSHQANRKVGVIAHAGNGALSRFAPAEISEHRLPGAIPGRGALVMRYGEGNDALWVVVLHLALGRPSRTQQFDYVARLVREHPNVIVMGDLNTGPHSRELRQFADRAGLIIPGCAAHTFPSWQPQRAIDHILISPGMHIESAEVLPVTYSDHRPLAMTVRLPAALEAALSTSEGHAQSDQDKENAEQSAQYRRRQAVRQVGA